MTTAVRQLLTSFESLPPSEQQEAAVEILRRALVAVDGDVSAEALVAAADQLFCNLDAEEGRHAAS